MLAMNISSNYNKKIARRTIVARGYSFLTRICKFAIGGSDLSLLVIIDHN